MWETCSSGSNWDIVLVVQQHTTPQNIHKGSFEAFILTKEQYKEQLDEHYMQLLMTLWLPKHCILKQAFDPKGYFEFSEQKLMMSLAASRDRDLRVAEKHFRKGNTMQAKKVLVHCIRYLDIGVQIKKNGGLEGCINFLSANPFREQVLNDYRQSWDEVIMSVKYSIIDDLWLKLTI